MRVKSGEISLEKVKQLHYLMLAHLKRMGWSEVRIKPSVIQN